MEVGVLHRLESFRVNIIFQNHPIWLLALDLRLTQRISFPLCESASTLLQSVPSHFYNLYSHLLSTVSDSLDFGNHHTTAITLVSGSPEFCLQFFGRYNRLLAIVDKSFRWRKPQNFTSSYKTDTICHQQVGGCTGFRMSYFTNLYFKPVLSSLRRTIGTFINYKHQCTFKKPPTFISLSDTLSVSHLRVHIQIPSVYKEDLFQYRMLHHDELCKIFGVRKNLEHLLQPYCLDKIVPIQLLQSLLFPNLKVKPMGDCRTPMSLPKLVLPTTKGFWIPAIQKWLPADWGQQKNTSEKVAKHDDADIPISLWDGRVTCLFNKATPSICNAIRRFIMTIYCRQLFIDFRKNLHRYYISLGSLEQQGGALLFQQFFGF